MATIHVKATKHVHLIFHHPAIVKIISSLLEGDYKDRRMTYFQTMEEIGGKKKQLEKIMNELVMQQDR